MRVIMIIGLMFLGAIIAEKALAEGYAGVMGSYIDSKETNHAGVFLVGGFQFNEFIGIEGRAIVNASEEGHRGNSVSIDSMWGGYITGTVPVTDSLSGYVIYGHTESKVGGGEYSHSGNSTSMLFGAKYSLLEAWGIRFESGKLFNDVRVTSLGVNLNF